MKKFLYSLLIFLLSTFAIQYAVYISIKKSLDKRSEFRITRYFRAPKHKYFVMGNSRGVNSINEKYANETLKLDILNLSFNGQPYANLLTMLEEVNSRNTNSVIFLELTCMDDNTFDYSYSYYSSNSKLIQQQYSGTVYNWIDLLRLNNEFFLRNIYYLKKSDNDWINRNTIAKDLIAKIKEEAPFKIFANQNEAFQRLDCLQKICNDHGNQLVYFMAPYFPDVLSKISDYKSTLAYMGQHSKKYKFINLNTLKLSDDMFADRIHTNYRGSILLTDNLIGLSK